MESECDSNGVVASSIVAEAGVNSLKIDEARKTGCGGDVAEGFCFKECKGGRGDSKTEETADLD